MSKDLFVGKRALCRLDIFLFSLHTLYTTETLVQGKLGIIAAAEKLKIYYLFRIQDNPSSFLMHGSPKPVLPAIQ